jgi:hypothetical protein
MDLINFDFPELNGPDMIFSGLKTDGRLLNEAKERDFYNGNTKYNKLFSILFFEGGKLEVKKDLPEKFRNNCLRYLKAFMGSFEPKHEEKEAICALLLSELIDIKKYKKVLK